MLRKTLVLVAFCSLSAPARAQNDKLAFLIPTVYGPGGLFVDTNFTAFGHQAHFNSAFQSEFTQFNIAFASQLAAVPLPSPASGFTYEFNPALGVFSRSTQSFGPILADRAETIGKGKFTLGVSYQYFSFDSIEGLDLGSIPAIFEHEDNPSFDLAFERDVVSTANAIDANVSQFTVFFSYGLADRLDLSIAIPIVSAEMTVVSDATVLRLSGSDPTVHFFDNPSSNRRSFTSSGSASGIGDLVVRLKGTAAKGESVGLALGADIRIPTGDEENLLGSGAAGFKPFAAVTFSRGRVSPHFNLGYQYNGDSVLAGDVLTGTKADLPDTFNYIFGVDIGVSSRATVAFDFLGQQILDSPRLVESSFTGVDRVTRPNIGFINESFSIASGAAGIKINAGGSLLIDFNLLFKLNDSGLRDKLTPLFGFEYSF
jgi:hypothetical protein